MALSLGAIHKVTGDYVYPSIANKKEQYICPECNKDLVLVKGEVRIPHFRHKADDNPCHYHSRPSESQMHKDAKMLMKTLLENKTPIRFIRNCTYCEKNDEIKLPEVTDGSSILLEYRIEHEGELRIADVAHIHDGNIMSIYEICHTHRTSSDDRPEPWVEIDAFSLLTSVNKNGPLIIECIRREQCKKCSNICNSCRGNGKAYWSDGIYGSCLECCCINCKKFDNECVCKYCEKCDSLKLDDHTCHLCEKCGNYEEHESLLENHCKECCVCNKLIKNMVLRTNGKCGPCYAESKM